MKETEREENEKKERKKFEDEQKKKEEEAKKKKEEYKKVEFKPKERNEAAEKAKEKMKVWIEEELASVKEAIRVRREVAVVRGSVESNRVAEGENLYGDDLEPGVEVKILPHTETAAAAGTGVAAAYGGGVR